MSRPPPGRPAGGPPRDFLLKRVRDGLGVGEQRVDGPQSLLRRGGLTPNDELNVIHIK
jgi:hypothetical protein